MSQRRFNNSFRDDRRYQHGDRSNYSNNHYGTFHNKRHLNLTDDEFRLVNQGRDDLFDKKRSFSRIDPLTDISMLLKDNLFKADRWHISQLVELKDRLNSTRNQLNEKDIKVWKQHTGKTNMTGRIVWPLREKNRIEMCTNAWIKMAEIFAKYPRLISSDLPEHHSYRTVHVCEAPGAFICATNFYHQLKLEEQISHKHQRPWQWTGLSLNPYYEGNDQEAMVDDDRLIVETLDRWYFGEDNSGNILDRRNIEGLWKRIQMDPRTNGVHLLTGDGSVDTSGDPNEQESIVSELHYAEAVCALGSLAKGGSLVLKMFNLFECETICLLYVLAIHFEELSVFKPASSRAPNGETYIVAVDFRGIDSRVLHSLLAFVSPTFPSGKALLALDSIPKDFLDALIHIAGYFTTKQIEAIERNLQLERVWNRNIQDAVFQLNQDVAREFRQACSIRYDYVQKTRIVNHIELDGSGKSLGNSAAVVKGGLKQRTGGTLVDRQVKKRDREEFLLDDTNDKNHDQANVEPATKRRDLGQGKTVVHGLDLVGRIAPDHFSSNEHLYNSSMTEPKESIGMKLMKKIGFREGDGLGANGQGRVAPIETTMHDHRRGFGHHFQSSLETKLVLSSDSPKVIDEPLFSSYDRPISLPSNTSPIRSLNQRMITVGSNLRSILSSLFVRFDDLEKLYRKREEYFRYCNDSINRGRNVRLFISDQLELLMKDEKYCKIHGHYLDYRSAMQLASLDKIYRLTSIDFSDSSQLQFIIDNRSLTGFAEYLCWQQDHQVCGIIVSEFGSHSFPFSPSVIIKPNIETNQAPVHLYFSDVSEVPPHLQLNRRYTEQHNKRVFLSACYHALTKLKQGGHFVCKVLDTLTRFSAGLIYFLYCSFQSIAIIRPFTVDPASPTRFLVCQTLKYPINTSIVQHLGYLMKYEQPENILEVAPLKYLLQSGFQQYLADTSQRLLQREVQALNKRLYFAEHKMDQQEVPVIEENEWNRAHEFVTIPRREKPSPIEPDSGITLPTGWTKEWSKREDRFYYYNRYTNESRWDPPT